MSLPLLSDFDFQGKKVLVRCDFDVPVENGIIIDDSRIKECLPTIQYLLDRAQKVILLGHLGRPKGDDNKYSLILLAERLKILLGRENNHDDNLFLRENLRFDEREEKNDEGFAKELAELGDFFVNEAFAVSHRKHASIVGIPKFLPHCAGLHFASEVENLSKVLEKPEKPLVFVIGGTKPETKMAYVESFAAIADAVLIGGTLSKERDRVKENPILDFADLSKDGLDISENSIGHFIDLIEGAGTVVWNGPMGKYEDEKWEKGTRKIAEAIANSKAFKIVGGGDTIAALTKFGLIDKMDYISTGGGAMLEFLANGTLPGINALNKKND